MSGGPHVLDVKSGVVILNGATDESSENKISKIYRAIGDKTC